MDDFGVRFALYWPALLDGALTTLWLCLAGMLLGFVIGVLIYLLGSSRSRGCVAFAGVYVSFFRGTPMLAQLLLLFYLPAGLGMDVPALVAARSEEHTTELQYLMRNSYAVFCLKK